MKKFRRSHPNRAIGHETVESYQEKILACRESRFEKIQECITTFGHCVVVSVNAPGRFKREAVMLRIYFEALRSIHSHIGVKQLYQSDEWYFDGAVTFFAFHSYRESVKNFKKRLLKIEESHYLGRFFDIDLYVRGEHGEVKSVSRGDIGKEQRRCFICSMPAKQCGKNQTHSPEQLFQVMQQRVKKYKRWANLCR